jgi:4-hydroxy-3-methylbut-2-enyl diphosphate reductase
MKVIIDPDSGFCFGVIKAVETAEQTLKGGEQLFGLGEMVHNEAELERLENLGLKTISIDQFF